MSPATKAPDPKPGWQSTEFWLTLGAQVVGMLLTLGIVNVEAADQLQAGLDQMIGGVVQLVSLAFYTSSRSKVKAPVKPPPASALLLCGLLLCACSAPGVVKTDSGLQGLVVDVTELHDDYVNGDEGVSAPDRQAWLAQSSRLRSTLLSAPAEIPVSAFQEDFDGVAVRYDAYVLEDPAFDGNEPRRRDFLRSTLVIRKLIDRATPAGIGGGP